MVPLVKATRLTPVAKVSHLDALGAAPAVAGAVELHGAGARPVPAAGVGTGEVIDLPAAAGSELPPPPSVAAVARSLGAHGRCQGCSMVTVGMAWRQRRWVRLGQW